MTAKTFAYESTLSEHSALRLAHLLAKPIWIHSPTAMACGMPPLEVVPCLLLQTLVNQLRKVGIVVADVALEGSAAAAFVCPELNVPFVSAKLCIFFFSVVSTGLPG